MGARTSGAMLKAREIIAEAQRNGLTISFKRVARQVGLSQGAVQKDAECQRLMPKGGRHAVKPEIMAAIELWEQAHGSMSKAEAARRTGVSSAGLVQAIQRKNREKANGNNG